MKSFIAASLAMAVSANQDITKFMEFIVAHGKTYTTQKEFHLRKAIFYALDAEIEKENAMGNNYVLGHNQFSDYTRPEYSAMLGYIKPMESFEAKAVESNDTYSPIDWRDEGAVTPVKDQGQCGSCWTFSSTGAMEGAHFVASGELLSFSEQQLVDCAKFIAFGCNGGNESTAFNYLKKHDAILESDYPYTGVDTADCMDDSISGTGIYVSTWDAITPNSVDALKASLAVGPTSVNIEADKLVFQTYTSGILDSDKCGTNIDHAVLAVGWGTDETAGDYWIVKNSWNTTWGDEGYIKIAAVDGIGICGVQSGPFRPTAAS